MSMAIKHAMMKKARKIAEDCYAEGGLSGEDEKEDFYDDLPKAIEKPDDEDDMVSRIMRQRGKSAPEMMAAGGRCHAHGATDCGMCMAKGGEAEPVADFEANDFDALDDMDPGTKADYTAANSGDELGDAAEDGDQRDIVIKIMHSRAKKDKMPRPA